MAGKSRFDAYDSFVQRRHRWIIVAWIVLAIVMSTQLPSFFASVNFNIVGGGSGTPGEAQKAQAILNAEFPKASNASDNSIIVLLQGGQVYSDQVKKGAIGLNETLSSDSNVANYTGMTSIYNAVSSLLNSTVPSLLPQVAYLSANISRTEGLPPAAGWNLTSQLIANATSSAFSGSPLFVVNSTSLTGLLAGIGPNATSSQVHSQINSVVQTKSFHDYPFVPESSITRNLVSKDNASMIFLLNFAHSPDANEISAVNSDVQNSNLTKQGTIYVTGSPVLINDIQKTFQPALGISVRPGIAISLIVVGLLFLAPIAAIIPLLIGGISIGIGLPAMYIGIVDIGHGSITFLTPTLSILLMLGLAVDYSVLQLRRTREERQNGKTMEESVRLSIRWAGQAVLTAGITVIVAYVVMAVANVPLFSSVGTAIALGVSILLAASLTLLPSLELAIGDKLFWPTMRKGRDGSFASRVKKRSRLHDVAEFTLKRKVAIATIISLMAVASFYFTYKTPVGADFLKLVPNFPSNQGLTAVYNSLGSGYRCAHRSSRHHSNANSIRAQPVQ